ncbi:hypothetical protein LCGC14_2350310 [marine sediment metagenome]|uniref:Uncharacterized protein n=1 Tax=marine sediment metagenome TaxID=412755 RepID=A0A0F9C9Z7_9ZZZZ
MGVEDIQVSSGGTADDAVYVIKQVEKALNAKLNDIKLKVEDIQKDVKEIKEK